MKLYFTLNSLVAGSIVAFASMTDDVWGKMYGLLLLPLLVLGFSIASFRYDRKSDPMVVTGIIVGCILCEFLVIPILTVLIFGLLSTGDEGFALMYVVFGYICFTVCRKVFNIKVYKILDLIFINLMILSSLFILTPYKFLFYIGASVSVGLMYDIAINLESNNIDYYKFKSKKMAQQESTLSTVTHWLKTSISFKMFVVGFLMIVLIVPMVFVSGLISERETLQQESIQDISSKWGGDQFLVGPILVIPFKVMEGEKGKEKASIFNAYFLPENLDISGDINPETLNRGIYDVTVYNADLMFSGKFKTPDIESLRLEKDQMMWGDAFISVGIADMRGIKENIELKINGKDVNFTPGIEENVLNMTGVSADLPGSDSAFFQNGAEFSFNINVNGSKTINFAPLGKQTEAKISSPWINPGFDGSFLPDKREITDAGFNAEWKVLNLNRSYPQEWTKEKFKVTETYFGVNLLQPVEQYQKIDRSAKYAFLFIFLTFIIFFFVEVINKTRIHPLRYLLVGLALIIFYTLLLSISEVIGFELAYLISAALIVIMISVYSRNFLKKWILTGFMFLVLSALYGFLFFTIQLQDYSLLAGSIGLFVILAILMYFSRKINYEKDDASKISEPVVNN